MKKVYIGGTGRAGTSILVALLTHLGIDTGFKPGQENYNPEFRAGCEWASNVEDFYSNKSPYIIKSPGIGKYIPEILSNGVEIECIIIPVRSLKEVVESRLRTGLVFDGMGHHLSREENLKLMEALLGRLVANATLNDVPLVFLKYPDLVKNPDYLYSKLNPIFKFKNHKLFLEKFKLLCG